LQPSSRVINDAINLQDRSVMRAFCAEFEKCVPGPAVVNLLLNERYDGRRFWNLLKMVYVEVQNEKYIFAVQTQLDDAYLPKALREKQADPAVNAAIVKALPVFAKRLNDLRSALADRTGESTFELVEFTTDYLNSMSGKKPMVEVNQIMAVPLARLRTPDKRSASNDSTRSGSNKQASKPAVGGRKAVAPRPEGHNQLALKMQYVEGLTTPVPNQSIRLFPGKALEVSVDNSEHKGVFEILTMDQIKRVLSINIRLDLVVNAKGTKECMITVLNASQESKGVTVDNRRIEEGCIAPAKAGSLIAFGDVLVLRVAVVKIKQTSAIEFKSSKVQMETH
jgi:hypothetical protein